MFANILNPDDMRVGQFDHHLTLEAKSPKELNI